MGVSELGMVMLSLFKGKLVMNADRAPPPALKGGRNRCAEMQGNIDRLSEKFGRAVVGVQDKRFAFFSISSIGSSDLFS